MELRRQKGLEIAIAAKIVRRGNVWLVPSQRTGKRYKVSGDPQQPHCTCPDFTKQKAKCKHIFAVEYTVEGANKKAALDKPTTARKPTYKQNWPVYTFSKMREKREFPLLLKELCRAVTEPERRDGPGRPGLPRADAIFAACVKTYGGMSGRRSQSDLDEMLECGFLSRRVHHNTVFKYLEQKCLTPCLQQLITRSSLALKSVEVDFAIDSSGFSTCQYKRWFDVKYGNAEDWHDWIKMHLICGVKTNIVTGVEISGRYANDSPYFIPLLTATAENFRIVEVSADREYVSLDNREAVLAAGGKPYIPFKSNSIESKESDTWNRMLYFYWYHQEEFNQHYHKRSNVETTFSMIKANFGEKLKSKTETAQVNEALCKVLCHNVCVVIQSIYELGIDAEFVDRSQT
jgi:transposase